MSDLRKNLSKLKVIELKEKLQELGKTPKGLKADLINQLAEAYEEQSKGMSTESSPLQAYQTSAQINEAMISPEPTESQHYYQQSVGQYSIPGQQVYEQTPNYMQSSYEQQYQYPTHQVFSPPHEQQYSQSPTPYQITSQLSPQISSQLSPQLSPQMTNPLVPPIPQMPQQLNPQMGAQQYTPEFQNPQSLTAFPSNESDAYHTEYGAQTAPEPIPHYGIPHMDMHSIPATQTVSPTSHPSQMVHRPIPPPILERYPTDLPQTQNLGPNLTQNINTYKSETPFIPTHPSMVPTETPTDMIDFDDVSIGIDASTEGPYNQPLGVFDQNQTDFEMTDTSVQYSRDVNDGQSFSQNNQIPQTVSEDTNEDTNDESTDVESNQSSANEETEDIKPIESNFSEDNSVNETSDQQKTDLESNSLDSDNQKVITASDEITEMNKFNENSDSMPSEVISEEKDSNRFIENNEISNDFVDNENNENNENNSEIKNESNLLIESQQSFDSRDSNQSEDSELKSEEQIISSITKSEILPEEKPQINEDLEELNESKQKSEESVQRSEESDQQNEESVQQNEETVQQNQESDQQNRESDPQNQESDQQNQESDQQNQESDQQNEESDERNEELEIRNEESNERNEELELRNEESDERNEELELRNEESNERNEELELRNEESEIPIEESSLIEENTFKESIEKIEILEKKIQIEEHSLKTTIEKVEDEEFFPKEEPLSHKFEPKLEIQKKSIYSKEPKVEKVMNGTQNDISVKQNGIIDRNDKKLTKNQKKKLRKKMRANKRQIEQKSIGTKVENESDDKMDIEEDDEDDDEIEIEYVPEVIKKDPVYFQYLKVFDKFTTGESKGHEESPYLDPVRKMLERKKPVELELKDDEERKDGEQKISKRKLKQMTRMSVAELKQRVSHPELVEMHDVTAKDPLLLLHLKATRNSVPVPRHWCYKRKYLQGKRGFEKPPFKLPEFIRKTGIMEMRQALQDKEESRSLKAQMREKIRPKLGKIDIDYQKLHDAFFKWQTKPKMTIHGDLYYEGKEFETRLKEKKPGDLSTELRTALGMPTGPNAHKCPPPWLISMQRYGPPPSYPNIKIPGLNAPIPEGCSFGYHAGGWGKPPVDEYGRPLYGDVFGTSSSTEQNIVEEEVDRTLWGEMDSESEEEESSEEEVETQPKTFAGKPVAKEVDESGFVTPAEGLITPSGLTSIPTGAETPDMIELRKRKQIEAEMESGDNPSLYTVIPEKKGEKIGREMMGSAHTYDMSAATLRKGQGIEVALDPSDLEGGALDSASVAARYEQTMKEQSSHLAKEDLSDMVAEHAARQKRKKQQDSNKSSKKYQFKF